MSDYYGISREAQDEILKLAHDSAVRAFIEHYSDRWNLTPYFKKKKFELHDSDPTMMGRVFKLDHIDDLFYGWQQGYLAGYMRMAAFHNDYVRRLEFEKESRAEIRRRKHRERQDEAEQTYRQHLKSLD